MKNKTILLVEDNPVNIALARILIKKILPEVTLIEAVNGKIAVEKFISDRPHLIFMDVQMPEMNGYDATKEIRKIEIADFRLPNADLQSPQSKIENRQSKIRIPIIALTAGTVKGEKEKCLEAGMDDYISKPIVGGALEAVIEKWLFKNSSNVE